MVSNHTRSTDTTPRLPQRGFAKMKELRIILHRIDSIKIKKENGLPEPKISFKQLPNRDDSIGLNQKTKHSSGIHPVSPRPQNQTCNDVAYNLCPIILGNIKTESDDSDSKKKFRDGNTTDPTWKFQSHINRESDTEKKSFVTLDNMAENQGSFRTDKKLNPPSDNTEYVSASKIKMLNNNGVWTIIHKSAAHMKEEKLSSDILGSPSTFSCEICNTAFNHISDESIIEHKKFHAKQFSRHEGMHNFKESYTCTICQREYTTRSILLHHIKIHNPEIDVKCKYCDKMFIQRWHLKLHIQNAHKKEMSSPCIQTNESEIQTQNWDSGTSRSCGICDKEFNTSHNLLQHHKSHNPETGFECPHCQKKFRSKAHLTRHNRTQVHLKRLASNKNRQSEISTCYDQSDVHPTVTPKLNRIQGYIQQSEFLSKIPTNLNGMLYHNPSEALNLSISQPSNSVPEVSRPNILPHSTRLSEARPNFPNNSDGISSWHNQNPARACAGPSFSNSISLNYNQYESLPLFSQQNSASTYYGPRERYPTQLSNSYGISAFYNQLDASHPHPQSNMNGMSSIYNNCETSSNLHLNGGSIVHHGQPEGLLTRLPNMDGVSASYDYTQRALPNSNAIYKHHHYQPEPEQWQPSYSILREMSACYNQSTAHPTPLANSNVTTSSDQPEQRPVTSPKMDRIHPKLSDDYLNQTFKNGAERTCKICLIVFNDGVDRLQHDVICHGSTSTAK